MIALEIIKEQYASLYNEELIQLAKNESAELTPDAIVILKQELQKRDISVDIIGAKENQEVTDDLIPIDADPIVQKDYYAPDQALHPYDQLMKPPKPELKTFALKERSLSIEEIRFFLEKASKAMAINGIIFVGGVVVTICSFVVATENKGSFVLAWGAILFGGMRFIAAAFERNKYKSMLRGSQVISEEKPSEEASEQTV